MKFILDAEQRMFANTLDELLTEANTPSVIRAWAVGDPEPGLALWTALTGAGVFTLSTPEEVYPTELVVAMELMGRHAVPGPLVETLIAPLLGAGDPAPMATVSLRSRPALDADVADLILCMSEDGVFTGRVAGPRLVSLDPARRLFPVQPVRRLGAGPANEAAFDLGVLACAAQSLGVGRRLLEVSVDHAKVRRQFGRPIGEFQAVKHHLADALVGLEFARPLVFGAALSMGTPEFGRDVSAAKVATAEAAYATAKIALQVHGAIGYTDEFDPSLWIRKARALHSAWGTPAEHRARIAAGFSRSGDSAGWPYG